MQTDKQGAGASQAGLATAERLLLLLCAMPTAMIFTILTPVLPRVGQALAAPGQEVMVRLALTVVGISMAIGSPLAGWLVDRVGVRILAQVCSVLWIVIGCLQFFADNLTLLIVMRFLEGGVAATLMVAGTSLLGAIPSEAERGGVAGWQTMIATAAGVVSLVLAGAIGDIDWRYAYLLHLLGLPVFFAALGVQRRPAAPAHAPEAVDGAAHAAGFWRRFPYGLTFLAFLVGLATFAVSTYTPFRFHGLGVDKPSLIARALTASVAATSLSAVCLGAMRRRISAKAVFVAMSAVAALGATFAGLAPSYWTLIGALLVFGLGSGPLVPNIYAIVAAAPKAERGRVFGILKGVFYSSSFVGAVALEPVMRARGPEGVLFVVAGVFAAVVLGVAVLFGARKSAARAAANAS